MNKKSYYIFFSKLSSPLRISIISSLNENPKSVSELGKELEIEQSKLSHALAELRECNIINFIQKGKKRVYHLNKSIRPILDLIDKHSKLNCKGDCKFCK